MRMFNRFEMLVFAFMALLVTSSASAQQPELFTQGMFFPDVTACQQAYQNNTARGYLPSPSHLVKLPLKDAKIILNAWCVQEDPRGETKLKNPWMVLAPGTPVIVGADGKPLRDARCNNKIRAAVLLPLPQGPSGPQGIQGTQGPSGPRGSTGSQGPPGPQGARGPAGESARLAPPPPPPAPVYTTPPPPTTTEEPSGIVFTGGIGYSFGSVNTNYTYPNPSSGDVPQKHKFVSPVLTARIDQSAHRGIFGEFSGTILGSTSDRLFQDITGAWNSKKRDSDDSRDKAYSIKGGYKFPVGDVVNLGVSLNYDYFCDCETYVAQDTNTQTQRSFKTFGLGVEASGSTDSNEHKLTVRVDGTLGLGGSRNKWTTQVYQGPPAITFPQVTDASQDAKMNRLGAEIDLQTVKHLHVFAGIGWSRWDSSRPTANPATTETTSSLGAIVGIRLGL